MPIVAENLLFQYPQRVVLNNVSFTIDAGQTTALVGDNGAGKTTLLRCLAGLEEPLKGTVLVNGINIAQNPRAAKRHIGYVRDLFGLHEEMTVDAFLAYIAASREAPYTTQRDFVVDALQIADLLPRPINALTRGMRQKVAIAQAIIHNPDVLLLDEPASGLDPDARARLAALMNTLRAQGKATLVSSHILTELEAYTTQMLLLKDGVVQTFTNTKPQEEALPKWRLSVVFVGDDNHVAWLLATTGLHFSQEEKKYHAYITATEAQLIVLQQRLSARGNLFSFTPHPVQLQELYQAANKGGDVVFQVLEIA
jgi:ABC-2 type transport system ATP-binding protein